MEKKSIWKINVQNRDRTTIHIIATSKLDAISKYSDWIKEQNNEDFVSVETNFDINFVAYAYE